EPAVEDADLVEGELWRRRDARLSGQLFPLRIVGVEAIPAEQIATRPRESIVVGRDVDVRAIAAEGERLAGKTFAERRPLAPVPARDSGRGEVAHVQERAGRDDLARRHVELIDLSVEARIDHRDVIAIDARDEARRAAAR